ncbi:MAG: ArsR/SmtB family transcription factor [Thermoplasmatota archaeon]
MSSQAMVELPLDDDLFKVLSSDTRREILRLLVERRMTGTELATRLNLGKPAVAEHLKRLADSDLIVRNDDPERRWVYYELSARGRTILEPQRVRFYLVVAVATAAVLVGVILVLGLQILLGGAHVGTLGAPIQGANGGAAGDNLGQLPALPAATSAAHATTPAAPPLIARQVQRTASDYVPPSYLDVPAPTSAPLITGSALPVTPLKLPPAQAALLARVGNATTLALPCLQQLEVLVAALQNAPLPAQLPVHPPLVAAAVVSPAVHLASAAVDAACTPSPTQVALSPSTPAIAGSPSAAATESQAVPQPALTATTVADVASSALPDVASSAPAADGATQAADAPAISAPAVMGPSQDHTFLTRPAEAPVAPMAPQAAQIPAKVPALSAGASGAEGPAILAGVSVALMGFVLLRVRRA